MAGSHEREPLAQSQPVERQGSPEASGLNERQEHLPETPEINTMAATTKTTKTTKPAATKKVAKPTLTAAQANAAILARVLFSASGRELAALNTPESAAEIARRAAKRAA